MDRLFEGGSRFVEMTRLLLGQAKVEETLGESRLQVRHVGIRFDRLVKLS
jgi:hypothetical protein